MHTDFFPTKHKIFLELISFPIFSLPMVTIQHSKEKSDRQNFFICLFFRDQEGQTENTCSHSI